MAIGKTINLAGDKALIRKLKKLKDSTVKKIMKPAVSRGLEPIKQRAKSNYSARGWNSLGELVSKKTSIGKGINRGNIVGKVYLRPAKGRTIELEGREVDFGVVGSILEFGRKKGDLPASPTMRAARDAKKQEALNIIKREARKNLKKVVSKLKGKKT